MTSSRVHAGLLPLAWVVLSACASPPGPTHPRGPFAIALDTVDGEVVALHRQHGEVVVVHAFTTWSLAAQGDIPQLVAAGEAGAMVVGLALDPDGETLVGPWLRANRIPYRVAVASQDIWAGRSPLGRIAQVPTTIILGRDGRVVHWLARPLVEGELARLLAGLSSGR